MRRRLWLFAAVALLALSAWLMSRSDTSAGPERKTRVEFPRHPRPEENERSRRRRTLPPAPQAKADDVPHPRRDPVTTALPATRGKSAVIFEASALKTSPVGRYWLDCMISAREMKRLKRVKDEYGVDLLEDVDRVAVSSEKVIIAGGDFSAAHWETLTGAPKRYGDKGMIYEQRGNGPERIGVWDGSLVILAQGADAIEAAIDRLEDRVPPAPPVIPDYAHYGDVYGVVSAEDIARMFPESERELADRMRSALEQVELHVDTSEDVAITANVVGPVKEDVADLGKSLGSALSLARLKAQADGQENLAELLDFAKITPREGRFSVDLALPLDVLQRQMGPCRKPLDEELDDDPEGAAEPGGW